MNSTHSQNHPRPQAQTPAAKSCCRSLATASAFLVAALCTQGCIVSRTAPVERPTSVIGTPAIAVVIPEKGATGFWSGCGPKELAQEIEKSFGQAGYQATVTVKPKADFSSAVKAPVPTTLYIQIADKTPGGYIAWGVFGALSATLLPSYASTDFIMTAQMGGVTTTRTGTVSDFVWLPLLPAAVAGTEGSEVAACVRETTSAVIANLQTKGVLPKTAAAK